MGNFQLEFKFVMSIQILFKPAGFFCWLFLIPNQEGNTVQRCCLKVGRKEKQGFLIIPNPQCGETLLIDVGCSWNSSSLSLF